MTKQTEPQADAIALDCYAGFDNPRKFMPKLEALRARNKYAKNWRLKLEKVTNRHRETCGGSWGWYEVFPLGIEVGFWGTNRDDLKGCNISEWNREAERISA